jgi:hypothetical protein
VGNHRPSAPQLRDQLGGKASPQHVSVSEAALENVLLAVASKYASVALTFEKKKLKREANVFAEIAEDFLELGVHYPSYYPKIILSPLWYIISENAAQEWLWPKQQPGINLVDLVFYK